MFVVGAALLVAGAVGLTLLPIMSAQITDWSVQGTFVSEGERIYLTGASSRGPIPRSEFGMMMGVGMGGGLACVDCHGSDARGGLIETMWGDVDVPDIRYSTLTRAKSLEDTIAPGWTRSDIARAIRDGVEPDGERLEAPMPRWGMSASEMRDLIAYLKELSTR